jgi:glucose/arabinose dehydrogenase
MGRSGRVALRALGVVVVGLAIAALVVAFRPQSARELSEGFSDEVVVSGLQAPTAFRFASDGRIFAAEKSGRILVFSGPGDTRRTLFADLSREVFDRTEHGLFGLALDPAFPRNPYVYVLYTYDAPLGEQAPVWRDMCPGRSGQPKETCLVSGRLSVLTARGDRSTGRERVLIHDWCQQSSTHSVGDLGFAADGALYVSAGDGAEYAYTDYGQYGNPCGDPPGRTGVALVWPTSEGGALRAQDLFIPGDPVTLDGTLLRVDPATGEGLPDNPLASSPDPNARRIIAYGFKQPFRFTIRPGTNEAWVGDVGHNQWEEINRVIPSSRFVQNFGWPCYEGPERQHDYQGSIQIATFDVCKRLYAGGLSVVRPPYFAYRHHRQIVPGDDCTSGGASISGLAFAPEDSPYPKDLDRALFFADATRGCVWALPAEADGLPDPEKPEVVVKRAGVVVDLQIGPDGKLYYLDLVRGEIRRVDYTD